MTQETQQKLDDCFKLNQQLVGELTTLKESLKISGACGVHTRTLESIRLKLANSNALLMECIREGEK